MINFNGVLHKLVGRLPKKFTIKNLSTVCLRLRQMVKRNYYLFVHKYLNSFAKIVGRFTFDTYDD